MAIRNVYVWSGGDNSDPDGGWSTAINSAAEFEKYLEGGHANIDPDMQADDVVWIRDNLTVNANWDSSAIDATAAAPITMIGVNSSTTNAPPTYADWATGANRPTITTGSYTFTIGDYYRMFNLIITGNPNGIVFVTGTHTILYNCKISNTYSVAAKIALYTGNYPLIVSCEFTGHANNYAATLGAYAQVFFSYVHDMAKGFTVGAGNTIGFSVFDTMGTNGLDVGANIGFLSINNTFNDTAIGISVTTGHGRGINNIFEGYSGHGVLATTPFNCGFWHKNHGNDTRCTDMWDGVDEDNVPYKDNACSTGDPLFDAANYNNSLQAGSTCINNALTPALGT